MNLKLFRVFLNVFRVTYSVNFFSWFFNSYNSHYLKIATTMVTKCNEYRFLNTFSENKNSKNFVSFGDLFEYCFWFETAHCKYFSKHLINNDFLFNVIKDFTYYTIFLFIYEQLIRHWISIYPCYHIPVTKRLKDIRQWKRLSKREIFPGVATRENTVNYNITEPVSSGVNKNTIIMIRRPPYGRHSSTRMI